MRLSELENVSDAPAPRRSFWRELRAYIITGLLIAAPVGITWWICVGVFNWVDGLAREPVKAFLKQLYPQIFPETLEYPLYGVGILGVLLFLVFTGAVARNVLGRQGILLMQRILLRLPFVGWVYNAVQQISNAVLARDKGLLQRAVLVQFPRQGIWSIAFVTAPARIDAFERITGSDTLLFLFIPTTPNPTSGWLIAMPESDTYPLDITVDQAIKLVISGGVVLPPPGADVLPRDREQRPPVRVQRQPEPVAEREDVSSGAAGG